MMLFAMIVYLGCYTDEARPNGLKALSLDEATGRMCFKARTLLPSSWPRDFVFVSSTLALVAMERSGEVHALRYDPDSGTFTRLSTLSGLFRPVALLPRNPMPYMRNE